MALSVVVPVYNEMALLAPSLARVVRALPGVDKEIIVVDDGSDDGTRDWLKATFVPDGTTACRIAVSESGDLQVRPSVEAPAAGQGANVLRLVLHERNRGKAAALRTGFALARHDVIVVHDADLEYHPADWDQMWSLIDDDIADVVYGTRFSSRPHRVLYFHHYLANRVISFLVSVASNLNLSDIEVCYKMFR